MNKSVLFVTPYFKPRLGGVETHVYEVSKKLIKKGWKVDVLTELSNNSYVHTRLERLKVLPIHVSDSLDKQQIWGEVSQYKDTFNTYDVIHVHDVTWWLFPWLFAIRKKLYITYHGWEGIYPIRWQAKFQRWFFSLFAQGTIHVGDFIQDFYWDQPTMVTYGGVDSTEKPTYNALSKKQLTFVFFGRLEKENGIEQYLSFFELLKNKGLSIRLTWVGDGSLKEKCKRLGNVTGMITEPDKFLKAADFVCASSYLSILGAQARGKVVCSLYQHPLKKDYLEKYPGSESMIIAGTAPELYSKIIPLIDDATTYKKLSTSAYEFTKSQTWDKVATQYEKLWFTNL